MAGVLWRRLSPPREALLMPGSPLRFSLHFFMPGLCTSLPCTMSIVPSCSQLGPAELGSLLEASLTRTSCMKSFRVLQPKAISRSPKPAALPQRISWG